METVQMFYIHMYYLLTVLTTILHNQHNFHYIY